MDKLIITVVLMFLLSACASVPPINTNEPKTDDVQVEKTTLASANPLEAQTSKSENNPSESGWNPVSRKQDGLWPRIIFN